MALFYESTISTTGSTLATYKACCRAIKAFILESLDTVVGDKFTREDGTISGDWFPVADFTTYTHKTTGSQFYVSNTDIEAIPSLNDGWDRFMITIGTRRKGVGSPNAHVDTRYYLATYDISYPYSSGATTWTVPVYRGADAFILPNFVLVRCDEDCFFISGSYSSMEGFRFFTPQGISDSKNLSLTTSPVGVTTLIPEVQCGQQIPKVFVYNGGISTTLGTVSSAMGRHFTVVNKHVIELA